MPFVATLSGFVALTAEITGVDVDRRQRTLLDLTRPHQQARRRRTARRDTAQRGMSAQ